jgi:hypothetical protein
MGTFTEGILTGTTTLTGVTDVTGASSDDSGSGFTFSTGGVASGISFTSVGSAGDGGIGIDEPDRSRGITLVYLRYTAVGFTDS